MPENQTADPGAQPIWTVPCPRCGADAAHECCSVVSGCVLDHGHLERGIAQRKEAEGMESKTASMRDVFDNPEHLDREEFEYRVGRLRIAPGDALVVKVDQMITMEIAERLRRYAAAVVPDGTKVLIIDQGVDLTILAREEIEQRTACAPKESSDA